MSNEILWAISRGTGVVATLLLTGSVIIGIYTRSARTLLGVPRFSLVNIHRSTSLFAVVFTAIHVVTVTCDDYSKLTWINAFLPFTSAHEPFWYGLGAIASDLLLALTITGIARRFISEKLFHTVHWAAYICWPITLIHGLGAGTDSTEKWFLMLTACCILAVGALATWRVLPSFTAYSTARSKERLP